MTRAKPSPPPGKKAKPPTAPKAATTAAAATRATTRAAAASKAAAKATTKAAPEAATATEAAAPAKTAVNTRLADDPVATVLSVLAENDAALGAGAIKQRLVAAGATPPEADRGWARAQEKIRFHEHVVVANRTYRYTAQPRTITPAEAVYHLSKGGSPAQRAAWLGVIEAALAAEVTDPEQLDEARTRIVEAERRIGALEEEIAKLAAASAQKPAEAPDQSAHDQYDRAERRRAARERQARIDAMSTVAELAAEVEELTAKRAPAEVLLEHTRALTGDRGLEAIGQAGEVSDYDEARHDPVGDVPAEGEQVIVIRPGYLWHAPGEAVLISRAVVKRR